MCCIIRLFKMVFGFMKKAYNSLRGQNRRDSEASAQGVSFMPNKLQSEQQPSSRMGKRKNKQQGSSSTQSKLPAPSTSPYHRRTGHNQSLGSQAVTHYPLGLRDQGDSEMHQHHSNFPTNSASVYARVEANLCKLEDECTSQNANGGSPVYKENVTHHPLYTSYQEENEFRSSEHTMYSPSSSTQSHGKKSIPPSTPSQFIQLSTTQKPPAFNGPKSSGVQQTKDTKHSQELTQVEKTINDRCDHLFDGISQHGRATRSHNLCYSDGNSDQGPVTRSKTKLNRHSTPGSKNYPFTHKEEYMFGSSVEQNNTTVTGSCTFEFVNSPNWSGKKVKTEPPEEEFNPKEFIPEGLYVPDLMLKRMAREKSESFCKQEIEELISNNEKLDRAMQLADQGYNINVEEMSERKEKIQEMYDIVRGIPFFDCETLKLKIVKTEQALRHRLDQLEKHLPCKVEEESLMDMDIEEMENVLAPNHQLPPDLDIPTSMADRIRQKNNPKYTEQQMIMLKKVYADLDTIDELIDETNQFCGTLAQLKNLKLKVGEMSGKVYKLAVWNHQPLMQRVEKAKLKLPDALKTIDSTQVVLQDVSSALSLVDTEINNKKLKDLISFQKKIETLEKRFASYLLFPPPVNLRAAVDEAREKLQVRQQQVNAVVDAFETFNQVTGSVNKVEEDLGKLQTVKDVNLVLNQINELLQFCQEFNTLDNKTLSGMKDFTCERLKSMDVDAVERKKIVIMKEELDVAYVFVSDLASQISGFWGTMAELQTLKQQIHETQKALCKFNNVEHPKLKSILDQAWTMLSDSKNLLDDREVLIEGQSCQEAPEDDSNFEVEKLPDLSKMLTESRSMGKIGKLTLQLLNMHRQLCDRIVSIEQGNWLQKQLVEYDKLLEHMPSLKSEVERKYQTQALNLCRKLQAQVKEAKKLKQDVPVDISSIALIVLGFYTEIQGDQLTRERARWLESQLMDCQTCLDAMDLPEGVAREARRDVLNLCNDSLKSLKAFDVQHSN